MVHCIYYQYMLSYSGTFLEKFPTGLWPEHWGLNTWFLMTGSIILKCMFFCQSFQNRWPAHGRLVLLVLSYGGHWWGVLSEPTKEIADMWSTCENNCVAAWEQSERCAGCSHYRCPSVDKKKFADIANSLGNHIDTTRWVIFASNRLLGTTSTTSWPCQTARKVSKFCGYITCIYMQKNWQCTSVKCRMSQWCIGMEYAPRIVAHVWHTHYKYIVLYPGFLGTRYFSVLIVHMPAIAFFQWNNFDATFQVNQLSLYSE